MTTSLKVLAGLGGVVVVALAIAVLFIVKPLLGAFAGLVFAWFFPETTTVMLNWAGLGGNLALWQVGAFLGFFGAFFISPQIKSKG